METNCKVKRKRFARDRWLSLAVDEILPLRQDLKRVSGVYVFYGDGQPVYVGQTSNLGDRLYKHLEGIYDCGDVYATKWGVLKQITLWFRAFDRFSLQVRTKLLVSMERRIYRLMCASVGIEPSREPGAIDRSRARCVAIRQLGQVIPNDWTDFWDRMCAERPDAVPEALRLRIKSAAA